ncbi:MAG: hypothetical protein JWO45_1098 [Spartobacteria bacterium]|nr:hypothetical protein [Spartobacteria bacterium]
MAEIRNAPTIGGLNDTDKGNRYAIHVLKDRRATMAGEINQFKEGIRYRLEQLSHLDATLRILDPDYRADSLPPKRLRQVKLFGGGELNQIIIDALRKADGKPLSTPEFADAIILAKGYGAASKYALIRRGGGKPELSAQASEQH